MIVFNKLKWRNFLSTGNVWNEVQLDRSRTTLVIGKNGEGKSTILDALCFGLFGKPFRKIKIPQLVNTINGKQAEVEIEFTVGTQHYRIYRMIKPHRFEFWQNGIMINQSAAISDYQKIIEQQILKINYKTFCQVCILGSASYVPFMQLPQYARRAVVEDILDISIFSTMNDMLRVRMVDTKEQLKDAERSIEVAKSAVESQTKIIKTLSESKKEQVSRIQESIKEHDAEIAELTTVIEGLQEKIKQESESINDSDTVSDELDKIKKDISIQSHTLTKIENSLGFFETNNSCPSCLQGIEHTHKEKLVTQLSDEKTETISFSKQLKESFEKLSNRMKEISKTSQEIIRLNNELVSNNQSMTMLFKQNVKLRKDIETLNENTEDVDAEKEKLKQLAKDALTTVQLRTQLQEQSNVESIAQQLLRDSGIKTAIIREYLPVMNKLINKYLQAMDFYVHFELDENFNETIRSRYRDEFTYDSFSEGEKMRIDLAVLFTWRQIAKMKNSINTSLLVLDEIFDSSLDAAGTDYFMSLVDHLDQHVNVFVISHKGDQLFDKFRSVIKFEKKNDFSVIAKGA